jgi:glutamate-1-semialdehyde 2,1-aminomutase
MGAMRCFLESLDQPEIARHYEDLDERWNSRAARLNTRLAAGGYPVRIANLSTIWVVTYLVPSRYNWMLQFYLRAHGLALSWVGTGRLIFNLACTDEDFEAIADRFEAACREMSAHGWWWNDGSITNRSIRRMLLRDLVSTFWRPSRAG